MSLSETLHPSKAKGRRVMPVQAVLNHLEETGNTEDYDALLGALRNRAFTAPQIATALQQDGHQVTSKHVNDWRGRSPLANTNK